MEKKQEGDDVPKQVPHTLESLREKDDTMLVNVEPDEQEEVRNLYTFSISISPAASLAWYRGKKVTEVSIQLGC